jgi:HD superfamily phosphohydrolase YqeK
MNIQESFDKAVGYITRDGITEFCNWLKNETDFFTAPASTVYHSNYEGGLAIHSLYVTRFALHNFNLIVKEKPELEYLRESVVLSALFHDIAKINYYVREQKWIKDVHNKWQEYMGWSVKDSLPLPHGPRSLYYITKYMKLTDAEALAITWHMSQCDLVQPDGISRYAYLQAYEHPLVKLIQAADVLALSIEETRDYKAEAINK